MLVGGVEGEGRRRPIDARTDRLIAKSTIFDVTRQEWCPEHFCSRI
jgi:hypothetical protein